jgi:cell division protein FtsB
MHFYIDYRQVNEKCADIQAFNCIADLIAENEALQKQNEKLEREVAQLKG